MEQGDASTSGRRSSSRRRARDETGPPRRGRARGGGGRGHVAVEEPEEEIEEGALIVLEAGGEVPRSAWPHGPNLRSDFAKDWDGSNLLLDPASHLSFRVLNGLKPGNMRTFSGFSSVFWAYEFALSDVSKQFLAKCAFGPLIRCWSEIATAEPLANLVVLRAFLDRYWDTTTTLHLPGYEAGITFTDFGVMSGLPCGGIEMKWDFEAPTVHDERVLAMIGSGLKVPKGKNKSPILIRTSRIRDYFKGEGHYLPVEGGDEENARLWLWWFLGATYLGDKGERVGTSVLRYLFDWEKMGDYDWVTPALGLTIKYCRDAVRPDEIEKGSCPSLVFPGIIMESWVFSHFPSLLPAGFTPPRTYPAVHGWGTCDRARLSWTYDGVRQSLNEMTIDKFNARPWGQYIDVPDLLLERLSPRDDRRLYLGTPYGSFWYLGERLANQTRWPEPVVPCDPPACLFVQTSDRATRLVYGEGRGQELLLPGLDYPEFARSRLACGPIEAYDEDMVHQPPDFPVSVEYEVDGIRLVLELPEVSTLVTDYGMEGWVHKIRKVAGGIHKRLWMTTNRWRELAARKTAELHQSRKETETVRAEFEEYRRSHRD